MSGLLGMVALLLYNNDLANCLLSEAKEGAGDNVKMLSKYIYI